MHASVFNHQYFYWMIIFITGRAWGIQWDSVCLWPNWMWQKLLNARHHWPTNSKGNHSKVNCHLKKHIFGRIYMEIVIISRAFEQIFESIDTSENMKYLVHASYLEIYNEEIRSRFMSMLLKSWYMMPIRMVPIVWAVFDMVIITGIFLGMTSKRSLIWKSILIKGFTSRVRVLKI